MPHGGRRPGPPAPPSGAKREDLQAKLAAVNAELAGMADEQRYTPWHTGRLRTRHQLERRLSARG